MYKSGPILIFKSKHKRTLCVYVGTVYCRLAVIKCRENIEKNKQSLIEYGDESILESQKVQRQSGEKQRFSFHVSCLKIQSTIRS